MAIFDRLGIKVIAGVGLCGAAMALSPDAAATSLKTGGYSCVQGIAGDTAPAAVAGGPVVAPVCVPPASAGAALSGASGPAAAAPVPAGAPAGAPVPAGAGAPVPVGAPVRAGAGAPAPVGAPAGLPVGAPVIAGAPTPGDALLTGVGGLAGKDAPTGTRPTGGPVPGQPILPGPLE
jgi:hypothetical protein